MVDEEEQKRLRRERAAAWAASQGAAKGQDAAPAPEAAVQGNMQVQACERVAADLAAHHAAKLRFVSGGIAVGSGGSEGSSKRQKTEGEAQPEATAPEGDQARGGGFVAWAQQLTAHSAGGGAEGSGGGRDGGQEYGWRTREGGLQAVAESFGRHNSASVQQAEMERMLEQMDEDYRLPRDHKPQGYIDMSRCEMASMDKPIPETNKGHQMLLRMGWRGAGTGLGRESRGIYDPIPLTSKELLDLNSRVGLGKTEEESEMHVAATESRNALESEIQANESEDRRRRREEMVMKQEEIKVEVQEIVSIFRCDICDKQYTTDAQYQEHLNSYDHHHKKRFDDYRKEEKARQSGGTSAQERQRKEQKRMEKEMAARASAIKAAAAAAACSLHTPPPSADPPPPPPDGGGAPAAPVKFGFAAPKGKAGAMSLSLGAKKGAGGANQKPLVKPPASVFGADDDDE